MERILIATGNAAKQAKLRWLIDGLGFEIVTPADLDLSVDIDESDPTHREVAEAKARAWSERSGLLTIASDGGARVPVLGPAWNSLFTRRAAGQGVDDVARADHLLNLMEGTAGGQRDVAWVEGVAVARGGSVVDSWQAEGAIGRIVEVYDPRKIGDGFWFPALIWVPQFEKVYADLTPAERDTVDDGWNALRLISRPVLSELAMGAPRPA
jgi:XTP/dITP diphosphohydrolase